jgi:O-antigen ligase
MTVVPGPTQATASRAGVSGGRAAALAAQGTGELRTVRDTLRVAICLLILLSVSRIHQIVHAIGMLRPALVLTAAVAAYAFANPRSLASGNMFRTIPAKLMAAFGIWACISAPFGISLGNSGLFVLEVYSKSLIGAFLIIVAVRHVRDLYTLIWGYVLATGVLTFLALFVYKLRNYHGYSRLSKLPTYDANDITCVLLVGLPLAVLLLQVTRGWKKGVCVVVLLGIGATMARSGSRGGFVGLVAVGLAMLLTLRSVSVAKRLGFLIVTAAALAVGAPVGYWKQMGTVLAPTQDYNWSMKDGRKAVAERGVGYMLSHPLFGLGIDNFGKAECFLSQKAKDHLAGTGLRCTPPHNSLVEAGAELGIPGLMMWIMLTVGGILGMRRINRRMPRSWATGDQEQRFLYLGTLYVGIAMLGFAVSSTFVSFAWLDPVYIVAAYMAGLYVLTEQRLRQEAAARMPAMGGAPPGSGQQRAGRRRPGHPRRGLPPGR